MQPFVVLLRGINVGGNNILPMQEFRALLAGLGCENVATLIQSGNAVFRHAGNSAALSKSIADRIESSQRFRPAVMVLDEKRFASIAAANPFVADAPDPKHLHVLFLQQPASHADVAKLEELAADDERFELTDAAFYLFAPSGIGRSKLAARMEKLLGVPATGRNWRTVGKIGDLLEALA